MNDEYTAPCGMVMGVQDADPRSSKGLRREKPDLGELSDGYHTFNELYAHQIALFIALCCCTTKAWRSKYHADGTSYDGWFVMGLFKGKGRQITYHIPISQWDETSFAETLDRAPEWDGHTSVDVIARLKDL